MSKVTILFTMKGKKMKYKKNIILIILIIYYLITLLISFFGPLEYYDYSIEDKFNIAIYMLLFILCLLFGYLAEKSYFKKKSNIKKFQICQSKKRQIKYYEKKIFKYLYISIIISLIVILLEFFDILIKNPSAFSITNMGLNYLTLDRDNEENIYSIAILLRFSTSFFRTLSIILGINYFQRMSLRYKFSFLGFLFLLIIVNAIGYGTQKFLGDLFIYGLVIGFINFNKIPKMYRKKIYIYSGVCGILFLLLCAQIQIQRYDLININALNYTSPRDGISHYNTNHIIFQIFGLNLGFGIASILSGYLAGGYYGLSLAFKLPFEWSYSMGSSYFLSLFSEKFLGLPQAFQSTYIYRMKVAFGRDGLRTWNTIFPWLASDFTFLGALLIFIPIGYIYSVCWREIVYYKNPISIVMFSTITLGLFYIPANNQLFHGVDTFISSVVIIIIWIFNHKKYNIGEENVSKNLKK